MNKTSICARPSICSCPQCTFVPENCCIQTIFFLFYLLSCENPIFVKLCYTNRRKLYFQVDLDVCKEWRQDLNNSICHCLVIPYFQWPELYFPPWLLPCVCVSEQKWSETSSTRNLPPQVTRTQNVHLYWKSTFLFIKIVLFVSVIIFIFKYWIILASLFMDGSVNVGYRLYCMKHPLVDWAIAIFSRKTVIILVFNLWNFTKYFV